MAPASRATGSALLALASALFRPGPTSAKDAFVFLGATGDNALRPSGVWQGVYEAFAGGDFDKVGGVDIHVAMNTPHTAQELHDKVLGSVTPLYADLQRERGWTCQTKDADCTPGRFMRDISVNIWPGRDAGAQAANMTPILEGYGRITVYLSVPPTVFGKWSQAAVEHWGKGQEHRVHVAVEKPFGSSYADAQLIHDEVIGAGVPEENLHLVDHWLSFFMNRHLPLLRRLVGPRLGVSWGVAGVSTVVVKEFEERSLAGRGGFFDGVGQVRDMVQSHLLQVLALALVDPGTPDVASAKLTILNSTRINRCDLGQYDGFLLEPKLAFHPNFADSTLCEVSVSVDTEAWGGVPMVIATGKSMGATLYTVEFYQRGGPGVLTFEVGKEETGVGGVRVENWPLLDDAPIVVPGPGFGAGAAPLTTQPAVSAEGTGYVVNYGDSALYFPKPYARMAASLLTRDYDRAFVTYAECERSWNIVTGASSAICLDPEPSVVRVYQAPSLCAQTPPNVCWRNSTVQDLYNKTFKCSPENDNFYKNVSLYQAKCHPNPPFFMGVASPARAPGVFV